MADIFDKLPEKLGDIAGKWTAYAAFASFLLYAIGYLALRFQVSTFGLAVDLDLFDEKYLFAGCRFLVFLVASLPNILIILLVPAAAVYIPFRLIRAPIKAGVRQSVASWCAKPYNLIILGIVTSVLFIQFVMRKCFGLGNLLLQKAPPAGVTAASNSMCGAKPNRHYLAQSSGAMSSFKSIAKSQETSACAMARIADSRRCPPMAGCLSTLRPLWSNRLR
jgi:hypothetical protein